MGYELTGIKEIKLNISDVTIKANTIRNNADTMELASLESDITSQVDALNKLIEIYGEFKNVLCDYLDSLKIDISKINTSVNTMENVDSSAGQGITFLNATNSVVQKFNPNVNGLNKVLK